MARVWRRREEWHSHVMMWMCDVFCDGGGWLFVESSGVEFGVGGEFVAKFESCGS